MITTEHPEYTESIHSHSVYFVYSVVNRLYPCNPCPKFLQLDARSRVLQASTAVSPHEHPAFLPLPMPTLLQDLKLSLRACGVAAGRVAP